MIDLLYRMAFISLTAGLFVFCDSLAANWAKNNSLLSFIFMIILSPIGYVLFGILNRSNSLSVNSGLVNMMIIIGTISVGIFLFQDVLSIKQIVGLFLAIGAVGLMM